MQLPNSLDTDDRQSLAAVAGSVTGTPLNGLLLRYSELSKDVALMRRLLEDLADTITSRQSLAKSRAKRRSHELPSAPDLQPDSAVRGTSRRSSKHVCLVRSKLERACLIALMETHEPVSVETIYDRIVRRGSFAFAGYKHPFRAIVLAMGALVRRGEARPFKENGHRRWQSELQHGAVELPTVLAFASSAP
jgi:hypothetical protein